MKRVFESAECEAAKNSIFWELSYERHENQMKGCGVELRVSDLQMRFTGTGIQVQVAIVPAKSTARTSERRPGELDVSRDLTPTRRYSA